MKLNSAGSMLTGTTVALLIAVAVATASASAQDARIGRLPLLAPMRTAMATCRPLPIDEGLRRQGVASGVMATDSALSRTVSLSLSPAGHAKMLIAMMSDSTGLRRREMETVTVFFDAAGRVVMGSRTAATTGVPARMSEDRRGGLLPSDTVQVLALATAVRACGRR
jgi:hypothetical protein